MHTTLNLTSNCKWSILFPTSVQKLIGNFIVSSILTTVVHQLDQHQTRITQHKPALHVKFSLAVDGTKSNCLLYSVFSCSVCSHREGSSAVVSLVFMSSLYPSLSPSLSLTFPRHDFTWNKQEIT